MNDPLTQIEDRKIQEDVGRTAARIYRGAMDEAANWREGFWATVACLLAVLKQRQEGDE